MKLHIVYRVCDSVLAINGIPRPYGMDKKHVIRVCYRSLLTALGADHSKIDWKISLIGDNLEQDTRQFILCETPPENTHSQQFSDAPLGHVKTLMLSFEEADTLTDPSTWVLFLEDDYLFDWNTFAYRLADFDVFVNSTSFHAPVILHPTDYTDQYTRLFRRSYLYQADTGYVREVCSTTFTFMCKVSTHRTFSSHFKQSAENNDDSKLSALFGKGEAICLSVIPSIGMHFHEGMANRYVNWKDVLSPLL